MAYKLKDCNRQILEHLILQLMELISDVYFKFVDIDSNFLIKGHLVDDQIGFKPMVYL